MMRDAALHSTHLFVTPPLRSRPHPTTKTGHHADMVRDDPPSTQGLARHFSHSSEPPESVPDLLGPFMEPPPQLLGPFMEPPPQLLGPFEPSLPHVPSRQPFQDPHVPSRQPFQDFHAFPNNSSDAGAYRLLNPFWQEAAAATDPRQQVQAPEYTLPAAAQPEWQRRARPHHPYIRYVNVHSVHSPGASTTTRGDTDPRSSLSTTPSNPSGTSRSLATAGSATLQSQSDRIEAGTCSICASEDVVLHRAVLQEARDSACEHAYCDECLQAWIRTKVSEATSVIKCPGDGCVARLGDADVRRLAPDLHSGYAALVSADYTRRRSELGDDGDSGIASLLRHGKLRHCPSCSLLVEHAEGCSRVVCKCGISFCFTCGECSCSCFSSPRARGSLGLPRNRCSVCGVPMFDNTGSMTCNICTFMQNRESALQVIGHSLHSAASLAAPELVAHTYAHTDLGGSPHLFDAPQSVMQAIANSFGQRLPAGAAPVPHTVYVGLARSVSLPFPRSSRHWRDGSEAAIEEEMPEAPFSHDDDDPSVNGVRLPQPPLLPPFLPMVGGSYAQGLVPLHPLHPLYLQHGMQSMDRSAEHKMLLRELASTRAERDRLLAENIRAARVHRSLLRKKQRADRELEMAEIALAALNRYNQRKR